jgi:membrane fusion protein (multidrug efflux system)
LKEPSSAEFAEGAAVADAPTPAERSAPPAPALARWRAPLMLGAVAVVLVVGAVAYFTGGRFESTDDAYVRVAGVDVSANIAGRVVEVDVKENQRVRAGQVLFKLDPIPYDIAIEQAQAQLADSRQRLEGDLASYQQKQVVVRTAEQTAAYLERERKREQGLNAAGAVSASEYDQAAHAADTAKLAVTAAQKDLAAALANLGGRADQSAEAHPAVRGAVAELNGAKLRKSWTVVRAPQDGRVTKVEQLQVGDYIAAAAPVFHLVADRVWIDAAFKENQLAHMRAGQHATVKIDAYPGYAFDAVVDSVAPGTDQTFSMLPAENASGNWVKVVQRVPVRLDFAKAPPIELQGGLSARVKVDTRNRRGLFGLGGGTR